MSDDKRSIYGTHTSEPDEKAGVEVGGADKAAAANDKRAKDEARPGRQDTEIDQQTGDRHEKRPEGPYKDPDDEQTQGDVK